ncbi:hypothetical protein A2U01_0096310, partial [Trifolium medium]|nr:hypothetical protein [Trifolium medium]
PPPPHLETPNGHQPTPTTTHPPPRHHLTGKQKRDPKEHKRESELAPRKNRSETQRRYETRWCGGLAAKS